MERVYWGGGFIEKSPSACIEILRLLDRQSKLAIRSMILIRAGIAFLAATVLPVDNPGDSLAKRQKSALELYNPIATKTTFGAGIF